VCEVLSKYEVSKINLSASVRKRSIYIERVCY